MTERSSLHGDSALNKLGNFLELSWSSLSAKFEKDFNLGGEAKYELLMKSIE
jgi:hypothetical protein